MHLMAEVYKLLMMLGALACVYAVFQVSRAKPSESSTNLLLALVCGFATVLSYNFEIHAHGLEALLVSIKFGYLLKLRT